MQNVHQNHKYVPGQVLAPWVTIVVGHIMLEVALRGPGLQHTETVWIKSYTLLGAGRYDLVTQLHLRI